MQEKYTKEEAKSLSVGLYVALALIAGTIFFTSQRKEIEHAESGDYYALNARFGRTDGLQIGDKVRLAGITVGRVVGAKLDDHFNAIMTMELKDGIRIPDDSSASIVSSGIMGAKYIEIEPGGSEDFLPAGRRIFIYAGRHGHRRTGRPYHQHRQSQPQQGGRQENRRDGKRI